VVLQPQLDHHHFAPSDHSYSPAAADRQAYSDEQLRYKAFVKAEIASSVDLECGICLDKVLARSGEKFGLLDGCNHVYCLSCIREWRSVSELEKDVKRSCPQCRETSHWVIPSSFFPSSAEVKDRVATTYSDRLSQIHCKHFNHGDGECPFGTSCFYRHEYRDGTVQRYEPPRLRLNDEGELQAVGELKLCDLIVPHTRAQPR
jgi:E3 ubiquitin-protein ligase makorin